LLLKNHSKFNIYLDTTMSYFSYSLIFVLAFASCNADYGNILPKSFLLAKNKENRPELHIENNQQHLDSNLKMRIGALALFGSIMWAGYNTYTYESAPISATYLAGTLCLIRFKKNFTEEYSWFLGNVIYNPAMRSFYNFLESKFTEDSVNNN
jgi:hypothetical protein